MADPVDDAIEPVRANLLGLLDAGKALSERHGYLPAADSIVMHERAQEHRYRGAWGDEPVEGAHVWAGMLLAAAETQMRTMVRICVGEPSVYGPQSLMRSGLEMAGRSYWAADPAIDVRRRIARYQTDRLFSAMHLRAFDLKVDLAIRSERQIKSTAKELGFEILSGKHMKHACVLEPRPTATRVYRDLMGDAGAGSSFGAELFAYLSAVDHGTLYALLEATVQQEHPAPGGPLLAGLAVTAKRVRILLIGATLGYAMAADRYARLSGWADHAWTSNQQNALRAAKQFLADIPDEWREA